MEDDKRNYLNIFRNIDKYIRNNSEARAHLVSIKDRRYSYLKGDYVGLDKMVDRKFFFIDPCFAVVVYGWSSVPDGNKSELLRFFDTKPYKEQLLLDS